MAKRDAYPSEKLDQYMLRFPDGMRERLKEAAAEHKRSLNAEIIARLEATLVGDEAYQAGKSPFEMYATAISKAAAKEAADAASDIVRLVLLEMTDDQAKRALERIKPPKPD